MRVVLFANPQGQQFSVNLPNDGEPFHGRLEFYGDKNQLIGAWINGRKTKVYKTRKPRRSRRKAANRAKGA